MFICEETKREGEREGRKKGGICTKGKRAKDTIILIIIAFKAQVISVLYGKVQSPCDFFHFNKTKNCARYYNTLLMITHSHIFSLHIFTHP